MIRRQRVEDPADADAVRAVTTAAFGPDGTRVADLVEALQASDAFAGLSFVAEQGGGTVGHVMLTRSWLDAPAALVDVLVLSPLSVNPDHQRRGVGRALVAHALGQAEAESAPAVFLEGDPAFYGGLGFERASAHGFERPSKRIPDAAFQVVVLPAHEEWMRGRVVYADRFWAFDSVGLRAGR